MDQITLRIPVVIKSKVTQELKEKILKETDQILTDIDREMQNLEFQAKRMMAEQAKLDAQGLISCVRKWKSRSSASPRQKKRRAMTAVRRSNWKSAPKSDRVSWNRPLRSRSVTTLISLWARRFCWKTAKSRPFANK